MNNFLLPNVEHKPVGFSTIKTSQISFGDHIINDAIDKLNIDNKIVIGKDWSTIYFFKERVLSADEYTFQRNILNYEDITILKYQRINNDINFKVKIAISNISNEPIETIYIRLPLEIGSNDIYENYNLKIDKNILMIKVPTIQVGQKYESNFLSLHYSVL